MPVAHRLKAKNVLLFRDAEFDFNRTGVSVIRGLNRNARATSKRSPNSNFIGKSLFFNQLHDIFGSASGSTKDRVPLGAKGSTTFSFTRGKSEFVVSRVGHGASSRMRFVRNGEDRTPKAAADQKVYAAQLLGMSPEAFDVIHYLDNRTPHPLRTGDSAARRAFFTDFFELAEVDAIRKLITAEKARIREDLAALSELTALDASATASDIDVPALQARLKKLRSSAEQLTTELDRLREERSYASWLSSNEHALKPLKRLGATSLSRALKALRVERDAARADVDSLRAASKYRVQVEAWKEARASKTAYLAEHPELSDLDPDDIAKHVENLEAAIEEQSAARERHSRVFESAKVYLEQQGESLRRARRELKALDSGNATCDRCGAPLSEDHLREELRALRRNAKEATQVVEDATASSTEAESLLATSTAKLEKLRKRLASARSQLSALSSVPRVPKKPTPPEGELPECSEEEAAERFAKASAAVDSVEPLDLDVYTEFWKRFFAKEQASYSDEDYDRVSTALSACTAKIAGIESTLEAEERRVAEAQDRKDRIEKLNRRVANADAIAILDKAFSTSGVKALQIRAICGYLESLVNEIAAEVYPEKYLFRFDLDKQFDILATRHVGGKAYTSDVRRLSGAEAGVFDLVLAMALATMLKPDRRWNFIVLDELDSNFSAAMTEAFVRFLPRVMQVFKHVIVITPRLTDYGREDTTHYFTVVKEGATSSLVKGKVT